jgi:hypothetical protein
MVRNQKPVVTFGLGKFSVTNCARMPNYFKINYYKEIYFKKNIFDNIALPLQK